MTTPQSGPPAPEYGAQPPAPGPYGQGGYPPPPAPPAYPAPGYPQPGYAQPGYPPAAYAAAGPTRPGMVTAAAVLCFIWGGLALLWALIAGLIGAAVSSIGSACNQATGGDVSCSAASGVGGIAIVVAIALMVVAGLLIWGGVVALSGKNSKVAVIAAGILVVLQIIWMIAVGGVAFSIFGIVVPVLIIVFLMNNTSKGWFSAKGGATF